MEREQINYHLQQLSIEDLAALGDLIQQEAMVELIGKPTSQTLLLPVNDPINSGSFFSGEILVTSAVVQVNGSCGWAMTMDDSPILAQAIATIDAAWAANLFQAEIEELVRLSIKKQAVQNGRINAMAHDTRVSFDLL